MEQVHLQQGLHQGNPGFGEHPVVCAGTLVTPGDVIVADDDGVVCVHAARAVQTLEAAPKRESLKAKARRWPAACWGWTCTTMREPLEKHGPAATSTDLSVCKQLLQKACSAYE